jgi:hypothetical protein
MTNAADGGFVFDRTFNMAAGPGVKPGDELLLGDEVDCVVTEEALKKVSTGWTLKFYCELQHLLKPDIVKVKYNFKDGEISGELLGSRLLWALGFKADRMYMIDRVNCYGCSKDPHKDPRIDPASLKTPRKFEQIAIERRYDGKEIVLNKGSNDVVEGFTFKELMKYVPSAPAEKLREQTEREALRLLAVLVRHADNKSENQAIVCNGKTNAAGGCDGDVSLYIHDMGLTFGLGFHEDWSASKSNYQDWRDAEVWADPETCRGLIGVSVEGEMEEPLIREQGRVFLVKLLRAFSDGPEGRKRVEAWFRSGRAEQRFGTIKQWSDTFYRKLDQIEFPLGPEHGDFSCPEKF